MLDSLQQVSEQLGHPPTRAQFNKNGICSSGTVYNRFGSWDAALEAAGLDANAPRGTTQESQPKIPDETLLADIQRLANDSGTPPTLQEYRENGKYGAQTLYDRFGSWNDAVEAAGFNSRDPESKVPTEALIAEIKRLSVDGDPPSATDMRQNGEYSVSTYRDRFGTWNEALEEAGFDPIQQMTANNYDQSELLEALQDLAAERDKRPTKAMVTSDSEYSVYAYKTEFGSWRNALEAAGIEWSTNARIPDEELLSEIRRLANELEKRPTAREMDADGQYASATYQFRFGAWSTAVEKAFEDTES